MSDSAPQGSDFALSGPDIPGGRHQVAGRLFLSSANKPCIFWVSTHTHPAAKASLDSCGLHGAGRAWPITFSSSNAFITLCQLCLAIHLPTPALHLLSSEHIFSPNREKHQRKSLCADAQECSWISLDQAPDVGSQKLGGAVSKFIMAASLPAELGQDTLRCLLCLCFPY